MAWHYKQYEREQSPEDRRTYAAAEVDSQGRAVGLWTYANPGGAVGVAALCAVGTRYAYAGGMAIGWPSIDPSQLTGPN